MLKIDEQILQSNKIICRHISSINNSTKGEISQDILAQLRHFVEHIMGVTGVTGGRGYWHKKFFIVDAKN